MPETYLTNDPDRFAQLLMANGMAEVRASVIAHYACGWERKDIAEKLGIKPRTVNNHKSHAETDAEQAGALHHILNRPGYLTILPDSTGDHIYDTIDQSLAFTLYRPVNTDAGYDLQDAIVIDGYHINDTDYLLINYEPPQTRSYCTASAENLPQLIVDWALTGRAGMCGPTARENRKSYADRWFVGGIFEPESLQEALDDVGVERITPLTDDDWVDPVARPRVNIKPRAPTGPTHHGYEVGYSPTLEEVIERRDRGDITKVEANSMHPDALSNTETCSPEHRAQTDQTKSG